MSLGEKKTYHVSGLSYTMPKLLTVIGLILLGQFAMSICIGMVPRIVPLKLKELGISSTMLVFIMSTLGQILNMTVCPWVSFKSDRYRSKHWGRRIPFILFTLPPLCASWAMLALYKQEAPLLGKLLAPLSKLPETQQLIVIMTGGMIIGACLAALLYGLFKQMPVLRISLPLIILCISALLLYQFRAALFDVIIVPLANLSQTSLAILVLAIGVVVFKLFYMFVGSVWYYVPNDVIPAQFLTRFYGAVSLVNSGSAALFNFFFFKYALSHFSEIMWGTIVVYVIGMGSFCLLVKEPRFPEPDENEKRKSQGVLALLTFARESFSHPLYWYEFLKTAFTGIAGTMTIFIVFFQQSMGLSLADIGNLEGLSGMLITAVGFAIATVGAYIVDRWHPVRVAVFMSLFGMIIFVYECKWVFFQPSAKVFWWAWLLIAQVMFLQRFAAPAGMPTMMRLLPKSRFGSFCAARSLFGSVSGLVFALLLGLLIDFLRTNLNMGDQAYRYIFLWRTFFYGLSVFCYLMIYYYYCKLGGFINYHAPAPWEKSGYEKMEISPAPASSPSILKWIMYGFDAVFVLNILVNLGWSVYAARIGADAERNGYLLWAVPAAGVALALYLTVRLKITLLLRRKLRGDAEAYLPHHGILLMVLLMRTLMFGALGVQAYLAISKTSNGVAAGMSAFEAGVDCVLVLMMWIFVKMETGKFAHTKVQYDDDDAEVPAVQG